MRLISTRGGPGGDEWSFTEALFLGQAPDGGLFVPASLSPLPDEHGAALAGLTFPEQAFAVARHFVGGEVRDDVLRSAVHDALDFPVPLREIEPGIHMVELFHGPTHAFKDVGARFMARLMSALRDDDSPEMTVLAATSGDTGGAVADAFHQVPGVRVVVLYPLGKVSPRQEAQFSALGGNVTAVAVRGVFDDCQRLVRRAFADASLDAELSLTSANSINIGRLLPQTFYYIHAWTELARAGHGLAGLMRDGRKGWTDHARTGHGAEDRASVAAERTGHARTGHGPDLVVSVPSGNFGNVTAGLMARRVLGMSRVRFVAATNDNSVVPEYLAGRGFRPRASVATISSAMDVGDPSNFLRILHMFGGSDGTVSGTGNNHPRADTPGASAPEALAGVLGGSSWTDRETRDCIRDLWQRRGIAIDPHTAVGLLGLRHELRRRPGAHGIVLATAHPAKFAETVEPLIGTELPIPAGIARVMNRPRRSIQIAPELSALREVLAGA